MNGFISKDGRQLAIGQKVRVYKNLHNGMWSIQDAKTRLVLGHCKEITLTSCEFKVYEKGRQWVLQNKKKQVHAYIIGCLESLVFEPLETNVYYNPYKVRQFVSGTKELYHAERVSMLATTSSTTAHGIQ